VGCIRLHQGDSCVDVLLSVSARADAVKRGRPNRRPRTGSSPSPNAWLRRFAMSAVVQGRSVRRISLPEGVAGLAGLAAAIAPIAGFVPGPYRDRAVVIPQTHGYDVGNLIAVAVLAAGLIWSVRGSASGRLVVIGALGCLVYSYVTYAFLIVLNPVTILYIAVLGLAAWSIVTGLLHFDGRPIEQGQDRPFLRRLTGGFMLALVLVFAGNWLRQMGTGIISGQLPADLAANGWPMNPVWVLDLGLALPLIGLGWIRLLRRRPQGISIAVSVLVFMLLLSITLLAMAVSMTIAGQAPDLMVIGLFGLIALVGSALAVPWLLGIKDRVGHSTGSSTAKLPEVA
jgi:hypothetical protein